MDVDANQDNTGAHGENTNDNRARKSEGSNSDVAAEEQTTCAGRDRRRQKKTQVTMHPQMNGSSLLNCRR